MAKKRKRFLARMQTKLFIVITLLTLFFVFLIGRLIYHNGRAEKSGICQKRQMSDFCIMM